VDAFAEISRRQQEIARVAASEEKAVFFFTEAEAMGVPESMLVVGADLRK